MLTNLYLKDFILIEELDLDFKKGFTVFTGETGAGKSIILDSITLSLGKRITKDYIRNGCTKSTIVTNHKIDNLYEIAIQNGALGGKLLGAGGGGFLLIYMKKEKQKHFLKRIKNITNIPFKFSNKGCEVILNSLKK